MQNMQEETLLRLEGVVENIVYRNEENGYTVLEIADSEDYITAVGIMPLAAAGDKVALTGVFTEHKSYGRQFSAKAYEVCRPTETADILRVSPATVSRRLDKAKEMLKYA